ncbi:MAG: carbamoyl-phosphate synthase domain-containing protein, partial [Acidimicrobiia bacterium]|nr:carbamoyl-phosphate synthase domain-containing protein [Acidimicrobiia bacterium]MDX2468736.1 carbamoyl-phosphate synthase domain-containing protein [Acidimicrobiia bacterium]
MARTTARGVLVLADGTAFQGTSIGAHGRKTGEVVFNTSMTGYQEIITDPSYARQIVTLTTPHIGNYGVSSSDSQAAKPHCTGLITRSVTARPSNWRSEEPFPVWLERNDVITLADIDTRRLTRHIRDHGAMPGVIATEGTISELTQMAADAPHIEGNN